MLHTKTITKKFNDFEKFYELYLDAFPKSERAPLAFLFQRARKGIAKFDAYYDNDLFVGFTYTITVDDLTYLLYFAIKSDIRSKGYGAQILRFLQEKYPNNRIILNIEAEDENAANSADRIRRRNFYLKNGYSLLPIYIKMNRNVFDVLVTGGTCTADEFSNLFKIYMGALPFALYRPNIRESAEI